MTIQAVLSILQSERQENLPSRFPCRAIMVKNIKQYCQLITELNNISGIRMVHVSEVFSSFDTMPKYENLMLDSYKDEWVILTGVSEYLRLFSKIEATNRRFAALWTYQSSASCTGRIIIPLWGCESQWFDSSINLNSDLRQQDFYFDCSDDNEAEQVMNLLVLSGAFEQHIAELETLKGNLYIGLQEWFEYWEAPDPKNTQFVLLTKRYNRINPVSGNITVHVLDDSLSFIKENMPGASFLTNDNCTQDIQELLFKYALKGISFDESFLDIFNLSEFSGMDVMSKWKAMTNAQRSLIKLWYLIHPDNSYLCHCFSITNEVEAVLDCITHDIFNVRLQKPEWVAEHQKLSTILEYKVDDKYLEAIDEIPEYEVRLEFLTNRTREERIYLLRMVGNWMRRDPSQVKSCKKLENIYPELFAYLWYKAESISEELNSYFSRYKSYKLSNTLPIDEDTYFNNIQTDIYQYRYSILANNIDEDTILLWIDALGAEWMPLMIWSINKNCDISFSYTDVTMANLPTETCFNDQWNDMSVHSQKLDKLDKLAHKGVIDEPDYYSCIEEQLRFVVGVSNYVNSLLEKHHRVIITGDHGTSRLAARFFHTRDGIPAPAGADVCSHGRYCAFSGSSTLINPDTQKVCGKEPDKYIVFRNYDHFKQSGFAAGGDDDNPVYGEVHGGATPEEVLVPVIVIDSNKEVPLSATWEKNTVKITMKKAKLSLRFNKRVSGVSVTIENITGLVETRDDGFTWKITVPGIKPGEYKASVTADNRLVSVPSITIKSALGGDGDLP